MSSQSNPQIFLIFFSGQAQDAETRGNIRKMRENSRISLYLNIAAIVTYAASIIIFITLVIPLAVVRPAAG